MESFSSTKFLAGTVPIPSKFPDVAEIVLTDNKEVQITDNNPRYTLTRWVSVKDFVAAFDATGIDPEKIRDAWLDLANWIGKEEMEKLRDKKKGIVYVTEQARVRVQADFGMSAEDCADYCPTTMHAACCPCCRSMCCPCC
jgi:hypothetical protein